MSEDDAVSEKFETELNDIILDFDMAQVKRQEDQ